MKIHKKGAAILTIGVLAATIAVAPVEAAKKKVKEPAPQLPVVVTSDHMRYHDDTGDIIAEGNVIISQGEQKLSAAVVEGNSKSGDVKIDGRALYEVLNKDTNIAINGGPVVYNWVQRKGNIETPKGHINEDLVHGDSIELLPDKYVVHEGRVTRCTKEDNPHYCIVADRIDIVPGQKMTAYNMKVQLLGYTLYSQAKYTRSLRKEDKDESVLPNIGYNSDNGAYIEQRFNHPLTEKVTAFADIGWYSKHGFTPYGGIRYRGDGYTAQLVDGVLYDTNGYKITKEPELQLALDSRRIGASPYHYSVWGSYGKWDDGIRSSWHSEVRSYLAREPIYLNDSKNLWLSLGVGIGYIHESYLNKGWQTQVYDAVLNKNWHKWHNDIGYHYNRDNRNLFNYNRSDRSDYWEENLFYTANKKDQIGVTVRYDVNANNIYDLNFTWNRRLNDCFQTQVIYKQKEQKIEYHIQVLTW